MVNIAGINAREPTQGKRVHRYFTSSSGEFLNNVLEKELRVAPIEIQIEIGFP